MSLTEYYAADRLVTYVCVFRRTSKCIVAILGALSAVFWAWQVNVWLWYALLGFNRKTDLNNRTSELLTPAPLFMWSGSCDRVWLLGISDVIREYIIVVTLSSSIVILVIDNENLNVAVTSSLECAFFLSSKYERLIIS